MTKSLLIELFTEELPPKVLKILGEVFAESIATSLQLQGLTSDATSTPFSTPRRLAVHITNVADRAADKNVQQKLMPATVGLDSSGNVTPALLKRLSSLGLDASEHDPLAGLAVTTAGFRRIGAVIARLGLPTVFVQEGGYLSDILGANLTSVLAGFEEAR